MDNRQGIAALAIILAAGIFYMHFTRPADSAGQSVSVNASVSIVCGNNVLELGEQCDGTALGGQTCVSRGFGGGTLSCANDCSFDTSECTAAAPAPSGGGGGGVYTPPQASVSFSGRAYPLSKITLLKDGQKAASTIAGSDANFSFSLSGITGGDYTFSIYGEDSQGDRSASFSFPVFLSAGAGVEVDSIFIAPTISVDKEEVKRGDDVAIFGQSVPYGNITISVNSDNQFFQKTTADKNGTYLYNFDTSVLEDGRHFTKSKSAVDNYVSSFGDAVSFLVGNENVKVQETRAPEKGDLNGDKRVNIVDFSMEVYWFERPSPPAAVDMNGDGKVDLTDFSIMAYNWTG